MAQPDAAVAIVHARAPDTVLLIRRAERADDPWSGHWSFPGGRCEPEDSGPLETALRELEEECGIRLAGASVETALPFALARRSVGQFLLVAPFVFRVEDIQPTVLHAPEAVEGMWAPLTVLRDPTRHALLPVPGMSPEMRFPAIDLNGVPLWGFTYRLITGWLGLIPRVQPIEQAGSRAAQAVLDGIVARGCPLVRDWERLDGAMVAVVKGSIPAETVLAQAAPHIPGINMLEVWRDSVRVVGLAFEEYRIQAC